MKIKLQTMLKHKLQWLVLLTALLGVSQGVYGGWTGKFYFDNSATQWANVSLIVGHDNYYATYNCTRVDGTDVWETKSFSDEWNDAKYAYWVNVGNNTNSASSSASTYASGFQERNKTVNQKSYMETGKIFVPSSATGASAGTTWVTYTASNYTSISGNGRLISTNGYAADNNKYVYIKVKSDLSNANYGEKSQTLKGWYWNTSNGSGSIVKASTYIGYNSSDSRYLYRYDIGSYFTGLIPLTSDAATGSTSWSGSRYYCDANLTPYSGSTTCYKDLTATVSSNTQLTQFTSLSKPTVSSSSYSGAPGTTFTISLTKGSSSTFSGGDTYRIYAYDGTNLYEICQYKTANGSVSWTPTTLGTWKVYAIATDKYGAERKKSDEITVTVSCPSVSIGTNPSSDSYSGCPGGRTLNVAASGGTGTLTYQWYRTTAATATSGTAVTEKITAAERGNYFTPNYSDAGTSYRYYCVVRSSGGCESYNYGTSGVSGVFNTNTSVVKISPSVSRVKNYEPVKLTSTNANVTWSLSSEDDTNYLYDQGKRSTKFKGSSSGSPYTITATAGAGLEVECAGIATVIVEADDACVTP